VVAEGAQAMGLTVLGFLDDDPATRGQSINGIPVMGGTEKVGTLEPDAGFAIGIGSNRTRAKVAAMLEGRQCRTVGVIHPSAVIASHTRIGEGVYIGPLAVVHVNARIGRHCIVNTGAIVDHECAMDNFAHVSANVILGGASRVGEGSLVGVGASVLPTLTIGSWSEVGAGAVVTRDLGDGVVAYGVPARVKRRVAS
jgi:sugar O-acyltransferase (sialic acid O-acetyltransferase NeuD family)